MLAIGYARCGGRRELLSLAAGQERVMLSGAGLRVARDLAAGPPPPFPFRSIELRDGADGSQGGIGLLRASRGREGTLLVMKYSSQGMDHGHFDRLGLLYYDQGREVLQDYGSARFINVETKDGGRYLPENKTWAKQTIAHNTITADGRSQYDGKLERAERHAGERRFFDAADSACQVMSAAASEIAPGVRMQRTAMLVRDPRFVAPVVIDILRVTSAATHQYDLPFYYQGQLVNTTLSLNLTKSRQPLGRRTDISISGWRRPPLWQAQRSGPGCWGATIRHKCCSGSTAFFVRMGAGNPSFNLRPSGRLLRRRSPLRLRLRHRAAWRVRAG
jgi:hypothetical protein